MNQAKARVSFLVPAALLAAQGCVPGVNQEGSGGGLFEPDRPTEFPPKADPSRPAGPPPDLGQPVSAKVAPPAISGGTLRVLGDGFTAVAADPDRDAIYVADLKRPRVLATVSLPAGSEPGRVIEDGHGLVHVALRRGGAVVTLAPPEWKVIARRDVCAAPRGLAFEAGRDQLHVACAGGELVSLRAVPSGDASTETRRLQLEKDLRDVVVADRRLFVSRFKSAEVLMIDADGKVARRMTPPKRTGSRVITNVVQGPNGASGVSAMRAPATFEPAVAWRLVEGRRGEALLLHQRALVEEVSTESGGYGSARGCDGLVQTTLTPINTVDGSVAAQVAPSLMQATLAVDVAFSPDRQRVAVAMPGNARTPGARQVYASSIDNVATPRIGDCVVPPDDSLAPAPGTRPPGGIQPAPGPAPSPGAGGASGSGGSTGGAAPQPAPGGGGGSSGAPLPPVDGDELPEAPLELRQPGVGGIGEPNEVLAVAFASNGHLVAQLRDPARLEILTTRRLGVDLAPKDRRADSGHRVFHSNSGAGLACASCHPEGGEDGRVWQFAKIGGRRTQTLRGGILATAPFHWDGDLTDLSKLMTEVFSKRMQGPQLSSAMVDTLGRWLDAQPTLPSRPAPEDAVARGRALFNDARVACATCHTGKLFSNNQSIDVGTGRALQVPSLRGIADRAPFMHNGCAPSLSNRFTDPACGGGDRHGVVSHLTREQVSDLVAFMESL
jgi:cytochrome c553